jgi:poly(A) polymerase
LPRNASSPDAAAPKAPSIDHWLAELAAVAEATGDPLYLVGGAVRDLLAGREPVDIDVAGDRAIAAARAFAERVGGTHVPWKDEWGMARVVCPDGAQVDFADLRGPTVEQDLRARDFTINAMALRLGDDLSAVRDPLGGRDDWSARLIRAVRCDALQSDPLRVLRAFRLAAELELTIEPETLELARAAAPSLEDIPGERIAPELRRLFAVESAADHVRAVADAGVWDVLAPELLAMQGMEQPAFHHLDVWEHSLATVAELEAILRDLPALYGEDAAAIGAEVEQIGAAVLKIGALLHDVGKPVTRTDDDGELHFYEHDRVGAELAPRIVRRWGFGRAARTAVAAVVGSHMRPHHLEASFAGGRLTARAVRRFFRDTAPHANGVLLVAQADVRAARGPRSEPDGPARLVALHRRLLQVHREELQPVESAPRLVTGDDLIQELGLTPGPVFREILEAIEEARVEGEVSDRESALAYIRRRWGPQ